MRENPPPRKYAEQVLGKAVSSEQLDRLFELLPAGHPVVTHGRGVMSIAGVGDRIRSWTDVSILASNPSVPVGPTPEKYAFGVAVCNEDAGDQPSKRLGVTIAFGRALKNLEIKLGMEAGDRAAVH